MNRILRFLAATVGPFRGWRGATARWLAVVLLLAGTGSMRAQTGFEGGGVPSIDTVRENEFRSRWADYQVDRPPQATTDQTNSSNTDSGGLLSAFGRTFNDYFRTGPLQLRADLSAGWEFSDEQNLKLLNPHGSEDSAFFAPALAVFYNVESGPTTISARYSVGYVYYLDQNYLAADHQGGILSESGGLDLSFEGSRATVRSSASGTYGDGNDIESGTFRDRLSLSEALDGSYLLTDFTQLGASGAVNYYSYSGGGVSDTDDLSFTSTLYGDYVITGKSRLRLELGFGDEHQSTGPGSTSDRSYEQALLKVNYVPSQKLSFDVGLGAGLQQDSGVVGQTSGAHPVYTVDARYVPTDKTSATLHFGYEGADVEPDFSLLIKWQPRPNTTVGFSAYQTNGFSTYVLSQNLTTRGILATIQQKLYDKVEIDLAGGVEQTNGYTNQGANGTYSPPLYYFGSISVLYQFNSALALQSYYRGYTGEPGITTSNQGLQSRASISLRLTF